jgi:hypothetical protein
MREMTEMDEYDGEKTEDEQEYCSLNPDNFTDEREEVGKPGKTIRPSPQCQFKLFHCESYIFHLIQYYSCTQGYGEQRITSSLLHEGNLALLGKPWLRSLSEDIKFVLHCARSSEDLWRLVWPDFGMSRDKRDKTLYGITSTKTWAMTKKISTATEIPLYVAGRLAVMSTLTELHIQEGRTRHFREEHAEMVDILKRFDTWGEKISLISKKVRDDILGRGI